MEWLRRRGITGVRYQRESYYYVFFEAFEDHWEGADPESERVVGEPEVGVQLAYRTYPTRISPESVRDPRSVAGGRRTIRCFKFFHDQKNYGPTFRGETPYSQRERA